MLEHWAAQATGPDQYAAGSWGPESADAMMRAHRPDVAAAVITSVDSTAREPVIVDLPSSTVSDVNKALCGCATKVGFRRSAACSPS